MSGYFFAWRKVMTGFDLAFERAVGDEGNYGGQ